MIGEKTWGKKRNFPPNLHVLSPQAVEGVTLHPGTLSALKKRWEAEPFSSSDQSPHTPSAYTPPRSANSVNADFLSKSTGMDKMPQREVEDKDKPNVPLSSLKMMFESKVSPGDASACSSQTGNWTVDH